MRSITHPSIARMVIFVLPNKLDGQPDQFENNGTDEAPAMITKVWDNENDEVNLKVFLDNPKTVWTTSVQYSEAPMPNSWHWPPRV